MQDKTAKDIMATEVITVKPGDIVTQAIHIMLEHGISTLPVTDENGDLVGIISEHDIMNFTFSGDADDTTVREAMTRQVFTFNPDTDLATLVNCCVTKRIRVVPIVDNKKVVGIIGRRDILQEAMKLYERL